MNAAPLSRRLSPIINRGFCLVALSTMIGFGSSVAYSATFNLLTTFGTALCAGPGTEGLYPSGGLLLANDGLLYATAAIGPETPSTTTEGSIYSINPVSGAFQTVFGFPSNLTGNSVGGWPAGTLVQGSDATFFGTTQFGTTSADANGTIFSFVPSAGVTTLHTFAPSPNPYQSSANADGANPSFGLTLASDGSLWGNAPNGGAAGNGVVFNFVPTSSQFTVLHNFSARSANFTNVDGANPVGRLAQASDGNFYGITSQGGAGNAGTIFKITTVTKAFSVVYSFSALDATARVNADGASATTGLTAANDGSLYGVMCRGGTTGDGVAFRFNPANSSLSVLYTFPGGATSSEACPDSRLLLGSDGNFYGTTLGIDSIASGTIFQMSPSGSMSTLYAFDLPYQSSACMNYYINQDGLVPSGDLIQDSNGNLYGTAESGGAGNSGTAFVLRGAIRAGTASGGSGTVSSSSGGGTVDGSFLALLLALVAARSALGLERTRQ